MQNRPREFRAGGSLAVHMAHDAVFVKGGTSFSRNNSRILCALNEMPLEHSGCRTWEDLAPAGVPRQLEADYTLARKNSCW